MRDVDIKEKIYLTKDKFLLAVWRRYHLIKISYII